LSLTGMKKLNIASAKRLVLQSIKIHVRFEVFTAVTMENGVFWDVTPCGPCKNQRLGGTLRLLHKGEKTRWSRNNASCN
jgi:hypothetical protein